MGGSDPLFLQFLDQPLVLLNTDAFLRRRAPLYAGRRHIPRDGLPAGLAKGVRLVRPYLVLGRAEGTHQFFRKRGPYLFAAWACLFHVLILPDRDRIKYELNHIPIRHKACVRIVCERFQRHISLTKDGEACRCPRSRAGCPARMSEYTILTYARPIMTPLPISGKGHVPPRNNPVSSPL